MEKKTQFLGVWREKKLRVWRENKNFSMERIYIFLEYGEKKDIFLVWREKLFS